MTDLRFATAAPDAVPVYFTHAGSWAEVRGSLPAAAAQFAMTCGFEPVPGRHLVLPGEDGRVAAVVAGLERPDARFRDPFSPGRLATALPPGVYRFANALPDPQLAALAWLLGSYKFTRYKPAKADAARLVAPEGVDAARLERMARGVALARDLINTPANHLGPAALEQAAVDVAERHGAKVSVIRGEDLLGANFPLIYAVGKAAAEAPRLVDFSWGSPDSPKVTLVGKGVCFDTGGLDIKPESGMALMKKDMGGAATALGLADMVMDAGLGVRLRVLLPIVENSIAGNAFRPGDIYPSRAGLSVEIGNTDAEGRLILADALALGDEERPDLMLDFATLTGAARVALGPDIAPFFTDDEGLADAIAEHGRRMHDPAWRLPLWTPYDALLEGKISALKNISGGPYAGSITAALFLRRFVERTPAWAHFDIFGWSPTQKPGRPEGGETHAARLLYDLLEARYPKR